MAAAGGDALVDVAARGAAARRRAAHGAARGAAQGGHFLILLVHLVVVDAGAQRVFEVGVIGVAAADRGAGQAADGTTAARRPGRVNVFAAPAVRPSLLSLQVGHGDFHGPRGFAGRGLL